MNPRSNYRPQVPGVYGDAGHSPRFSESSSPPRQDAASAPPATSERRASDVDEVMAERLSAGGVLPAGVARFAASLKVPG